MISRQRVNDALNHQIPDKVPLDFGGNQTGIHIKAYRRLIEYLEIEDKEIHTYDYIQQLAAPCEEILERFSIDTRYIRPLGGMVKIDEFELEYAGRYMGVYDQFGCFWGNDANKDIDAILYYDPVIHPFESFKTVQEIRDFEWPDGTDKSSFEGLREYARKLHETTDYALVSAPTGCIYEYTTFLFGFTKALKHLKKKPELIEAAMEGLLQYWTDYNVTFLNEVGEFLDVLCINGDLAEQAGPIMDLRTYERVIKPYEKKLSEKVHTLADIKVNYHCCGSIPQFIPHFVDTKYDAVNPVQISAYDMEPCSLKERFGKIITFWGGLCNTQNTLPFGTFDKIKKEVQRNFICLKPGGGFIAANIHNVTAEVPAANIVAMFDAAIEFRNY